MLAKEKIIAFLPTMKPQKSKVFFKEILGLKLLSEDGFALEFNAGDTTLRVTIVNELSPHPFTVLGWKVNNLNDRMRALIKKGVVFERYDFMKQDNLGIWTAPGGTKVAWFKDPDGNLLSLSETGRIKTGKTRRRK